MSKRYLGAAALLLAGCHSCIGLDSVEFDGGGNGAAPTVGGAGAGGADGAGGQGGGGKGGAAGCTCFVGECVDGTCQPLLLGDEELSPASLVVSDGAENIEGSVDGNVIWADAGTYDATNKEFTGRIVKCVLPEKPGDGSGCLATNRSRRTTLAAHLQSPKWIVFGRHQREVVYATGGDAYYDGNDNMVHTCRFLPGTPCDADATMTQGPFQLRGALASHAGIVYIPTDTGVLMWSLQANKLVELTQQIAHVIVIDHPAKAPDDHSADRLYGATRDHLSADIDAVWECQLGATPFTGPTCSPTFFADNLNTPQSDLHDLAVVGDHVYATNRTNPTVAGTLWEVGSSGITRQETLSGTTVSALIAHASSDKEPPLLYFAGINGEDDLEPLGVIRPAGRQLEEASLPLAFAGSRYNFPLALTQNANGLYISSHSNEFGAVWALDTSPALSEGP